jgi:hypothetical protein
MEQKSILSSPVKRAKRKRQLQHIDSRKENSTMDGRTKEKRSKGC